jgi:hypothetical protein
MKARAKAQLQIQEMAFVLVGLILFFGLIMLFFAVFQQAKIKSLAEQTRREEIVAKLHSIVNMPEFACREAFCIDEEKVQGFLALSQKQKYYEKFDKQYIVLIKVERVWSQEGAGSNICNKENVPQSPSNCKTYEIYNNTAKKSSYEAHSTFTLMCHHTLTNGQAAIVCDVGKIVVGFEVPK